MTNDRDSLPNSLMSYSNSSLKHLTNRRKKLVMTHLRGIPLLLNTISVKNST